MHSAATARAGDPEGFTRPATSCSRRHRQINPGKGAEARGRTPRRGFVQGVSGIRGATTGVDPARILRRFAAVAALFAVSLIAAAPATAQVRVGGHGLYQLDLLDGTFGYGGRVEFDLGFLWEDLVVTGIYDRYSPDCPGCSYWKTGAQAGLLSRVGYFGLGTYFSRFEDPGAGAGNTIEDDWTYELVAAIRYPLGLLTPFFEIRNELGQGILNKQTLVAGVLLGPYLRSGSRRTSSRGTR